MATVRVATLLSGSSNLSLEERTKKNDDNSGSQRDS